MSNTKRIAKNTIFLYIRMFLMMGVSLYTSRIVLGVLGIQDYGIYAIVGGIVSLFGFLNAAMSSATQRFLTFDIGQENYEQLKKTFNTTLLIHIGISLVVLVCAESIGLWYVNTKLNVPIERMYAVNVIYQFSIFTAIVGVMQVPFTALLIARERMNVFAILSIIDVVCKLGIVFLLIILPYDKLIVYSFLIFAITLIIAISYRIYCYKHFRETGFAIYKDKAYYKKLLSYSGWNLFGNIAAVGRGQGTNLVLNFFFGTMINAAYGIMLQVQSAVQIFVTNFQLAVNPQIIKNYSQGNISSMQRLVFQSSKFSFFLMSFLTVPILFNIDFILQLWLNIVPPYATSFIQICLVYILVECISGPLMTAAQATGKIKWYQIIVGSLIFLNLPISIIVVKLTNNPVSVIIIWLIISIISLQFRLYFLKRIINFDVRMFFKDVLLRILLISLLILIIAIVIKEYMLISNDYIYFLVSTVLLLLSLLILIWSFGLNSGNRIVIKDLLKKKFRNKE